MNYGETVIEIKRVYEAPAAADGFRILIDRLWPRGLSKEKAKVDLWLKEVAPSTGLRKAFGHEPAQWADFQSRYGRELDQKADLLKEIKRLEREKKIVTLVYGAKDERHNNAVVLRARLAESEDRGRRCRRRRP